MLLFKIKKRGSVSGANTCQACPEHVCAAAHLTHHTLCLGDGCRLSYRWETEAQTGRLPQLAGSAGGGEDSHAVCVALDPAHATTTVSAASTR